jgi:hypothetical protein
VLLQVLWMHPGPKQHSAAVTAVVLVTGDVACGLPSWLVSQFGSGTCVCGEGEARGCHPGVKWSYCLLQWALGSRGLRSFCTACLLLICMFSVWCFGSQRYLAG